METIQITDEYMRASLSLEATKFCFDNISTNPEKNSETIYNLKLELLTAHESIKQMRADYKKQIERSEKRHVDRIQHALDSNAEMIKEYSDIIETYKTQIEQLKRQIK